MASYLYSEQLGRRYSDYGSLRWNRECGQRDIAEVGDIDWPCGRAIDVVGGVAL